MTIPVYQKYISSLDAFIEEQNSIKQQYIYKTNETYNESLNFFGDVLIQPLILCNSTITFLLLSIPEKFTTNGKKQIQKLQLITAYFHGLDISTNLILEGNYFKAAAAIKQDYEIVVRLGEVQLGKAKRGQTPNPQNGPSTFKTMYGYLNSIAHPSNDCILNGILKTTEKNSQAISFAKQFSKKFAHRLMAYNIAVKVEIFRQTLIFYEELVKQDNIYEHASVYYDYIIDIYSKLGIFGADPK